MVIVRRPRLLVRSYPWAVSADAGPDTVPHTQHARWACDCLPTFRSVLCQWGPPDTLAVCGLECLVRLHAPSRTRDLAGHWSTIRNRVRNVQRMPARSADQLLPCTLWRSRFQPQTCN